MTRQEKIAWLANASNEEVVNQLRWAVTAMDHRHFRLKDRKILNWLRQRF